tara:strand:- start:369 stop:479 length:111 start_codon:yes stop_codon:yes gene_type:complete
MAVIKTRIFEARLAKEIHDEEIMIFKGTDCLYLEGI